MFIGSEILPDPEPFLRGVTRGPVPDLEPLSLRVRYQTTRQLKLGRVGMGQVLHLWPSWHGPSIMWTKLVLGRVVLHPSELRPDLRNCHDVRMT